MGRFIGPRGAQGQGVIEARADDLQAHRKAVRRESAGHHRRRLSGQVEGVTERRPFGPARHARAGRNFDARCEGGERQGRGRMGRPAPAIAIDPMMSPHTIVEARGVVDGIYMDDKIKDYIVDLTFATRDPGAFDIPVADWVQYGASPRATLALTLGAKASAFLEGRGYVTPQDVKSIAMDVLRHRVIITYEAEAEEKTSEDVVRAVLDHVAVP